ncbi:beta-1,3-N-acetylglucosaminyltransferase lunatic fringe [Saccoglossus kowalevskii]|uniref:Beta-1,3-N-acetylglucosaminyltransferase lunatic fringe n=1 Tax=Saccoglossus kowalevskii TaxID=10224 RepID=A0ABM0MZF5_SACKO|nr:PREDICTED: beta-1,3-N-acetylglucosaminyltransferase lunatic fringe [Saccoglossus kowalevskii]
MRLRAKRTLQGLVLTAILCLIALQLSIPSNGSEITAEVERGGGHGDGVFDALPFMSEKVDGAGISKALFHDRRHIQGLPDAQIDSVRRKAVDKFQQLNSSDEASLFSQDEGDIVDQRPAAHKPKHGSLAQIHSNVYNRNRTQSNNSSNVQLGGYAKLSMGLLDMSQMVTSPVNSPRRTELSDIFIGVKTTKRYHAERLDLLLDTWVDMSLEQTYLFTDQEDYEYNKKLHGHLINTNCSSLHTRQALCCKMSAMYDMFLESHKRWFCHVDDDNYLNVAQLVKLLQQYRHTDDVYLGKPSLSHPIEAVDRTNNMRRVSFWFATGGAGFCLSRAMALHMSPYASGGSFSSMCNRIRLPDDVTVGFIVEVLLKKKLTKVSEFNSHLEALWQIKKLDLPKQVTLSYSKGTKKYKNVITLDNRVFSDEQDPTRLKSLHCMMFPQVGECALMARPPSLLSGLDDGWPHLGKGNVV